MDTSRLYNHKVTYELWCDAYIRYLILYILMIASVCTVCRFYSTVVTAGLNFSLYFYFFIRTIYNHILCKYQILQHCRNMKRRNVVSSLFSSFKVIFRFTSLPVFCAQRENEISFLHRTLKRSISLTKIPN